MNCRVCGNRREEQQLVDAELQQVPQPGLDLLARALNLTFDQGVEGGTPADDAQDDFGGKTSFVGRERVRGEELVEQIGDKRPILSIGVQHRQRELARVLGRTQRGGARSGLSRSLRRSSTLTHHRTPQRASRSSKNSG